MTTEDNDIVNLLDTRGLVCPEPVMMLHGKVRQSTPGDMIKVLASDPSTQRDIPKFCHFLGHELVSESSDQEGEFCFLIRVVAR